MAEMAVWGDVSKIKQHGKINFLDSVKESQFKKR